MDKYEKVTKLIQREIKEACGRNGRGGYIENVPDAYTFLYHLQYILTDGKKGEYNKFLDIKYLDINEE